MSIKDLAQQWGSSNRCQDKTESFEVDMPLQSAAKIHALAQMYTSGNVNELVKDLLLAALQEIECTFPYVAGDTVVGEDELGDPIYEDVGPTPQFLDLMRSHLSQLS